MKALIIGSGIIENYSKISDSIEKYDYIICADGGTRHSRALGLKPNIIIGDLDSTTNPDLKFYQEIGVKIEQHPTKKNMTDMELCLESLKNQYDEILILGATGGRLDHFMGNLLLLFNYFDKDKKIRIIDERNEISVLKDSSFLEMSGAKNEYVSLIPVSEEVTGVTTDGLLYELNNFTLAFGTTLGISNEILNKKIKISIETGKLIVIKSKDK